MPNPLLLPVIFSLASGSVSVTQANPKTDASWLQSSIQIENPWQAVPTKNRRLPLSIDETGAHHTLDWRSDAWASPTIIGDLDHHLVTPSPIKPFDLDPGLFLPGHPEPAELGLCPDASFLILSTDAH